MMPIAALDVSANSAALLDGDTGAILWEKNAHEKSLIASTTKIMTALVVLENADLRDKVEIPPEAVGIEGSSMYLKEGETLSVEDLLYGMMLSSGNDAAVALSIHVSGSPEAFAEEMNRRAQELGLADTHFANPNGLDSDGNYSTAESLGKLAAAAMQNEDFRAIVSAKTYHCEGHTMTNHNKLLWQYDGAVGVKTGFTKQAGRILVGCAEKNGRRLISVTINAPSDWSDHRAMLDYGFAGYELRTVLKAGDMVGELPVISGTRETVPLLAGDEISWYMRPEETASFRLQTAPFVYAPVERGQQLGTIDICVGEKLVGTTPVYAGERADLPPEEPGFWDRLIQKITD